MRQIIKKTRITVLVVMVVMIIFSSYSYATIKNMFVTADEFLGKRRFSG